MCQLHKNVCYCDSEGTTAKNCEILKVNRSCISSGGIYVDIIVSKVTMNLLVDAGSAMLPMQENVYKKSLPQKFLLLPATMNFPNYSRHQIAVIGYSLLPREYHSHTMSVCFMLCKGHCILGTGHYSHHRSQYSGTSDLSQDYFCYLASC